MLKRIFKLVAAVDLPNSSTKHTLVYELLKPVPKVPGEPDDNMVVAHMDYEEVPDESGDLTGMYRVLLAPPEGSDLHAQGISVMIEHSVNDVMRVYEAISLKDVQLVLNNFQIAYEKAIKEGSEEADDASDESEAAAQTQAVQPDQSAAVPTA